jgi:hopene-associated glycosyltransferase HpnB
MLAFLSFLSLIIWLVLVLAWGNFWRIWESAADHHPLTAPEKWPRVVAIVPARNEATSIAQVVSALAQQDYAGNFSVIVVDDHSEDATADVARKSVQDSGAATKVQILPAPDLAPGWTGKLWALNAGVASCSATSPAADPLVTNANTPDFLWFTDADVVHAPDTLGRLVFRAQSDNLDLTSLMVLLESRTFAERLLIPAFLYFFLMLYPPTWIANSRAQTAGAAGGCVLLRRAALERIGGLAAIRFEVIDDCALARAVKHSGGKIWMGLTRASRSLRSYDGFTEIRDMIARTAFTQLNYSALQLFGTLLGLTITFLLPVALTLAPSASIWFPALLAWCLMTASFLPTITFYRLSPLWSPLLPIAAAFYTYATLLSAIRYWRGQGAQWKGRSQAPQNSPSNPSPSS